MASGAGPIARSAVGTTDPLRAPSRPSDVRVAHLGRAVRAGLDHRPVLVRRRPAVGSRPAGRHDGPLARHQHSSSQQGSFTASFCDQIIVSVVTITLISGPEPLIGVWAGSLFMVLYIGVLAMSMVRNALRAPYSWLIRPRFFLFAAIPGQLLGIPHLVWTVVWVSNPLLILKTASGFFKLRDRLPGPDAASDTEPDRSRRDRS